MPDLGLGLGLGWVVVLVVVGLFVLFRMFLRRPSSGRLGIPNEKEALTQYVRKNRGRIEAAKIASRRGGVSLRDQRWLRALGKKISRVGLQTRDLDGIDVMAAIFAINPLSHRGDPSATSTKNYLQRVIVTHKQDEITAREGRGKYEGTTELKAGPFSSHLPQHVAKKLDRPGKKKIPDKFKPPRKGW